jgi:cytochrome c biogenesis protein CcdA
MVMPTTGIVDSSVALVVGLTWNSCAGPVIGVIKVISVHRIGY